MTRKLPQVLLYRDQRQVQAGRVLTYRGSPWPTETPFLGSSTRKTLVMSTGHRYPYHSWDGFYQVTDFEFLHSQKNHVSKGPPVGSYQWVHAGTLWPSRTVSGCGLPAYFSRASELANLSARWGSVGWDRTRPTRQLASLNQFFIELRELPLVPFLQIALAIKFNRGRSIGTQINAARRAAGSEYLNFDFGWRPLVDDVMKIWQFQEKWERQLRFLRRNAYSASTIRRRTTLVDETSVTATSGTNAVASYVDPAPLGTWTGSWAKTVTTKKKVWFAAGYTVSLPPQTPANVERMRRAFLGQTPTFETVWAVTPWSWLAGWFTSVNSVGRNWADPLRDHYAARYAFCMCRLETKTSWSASLNATAPVDGTSNKIDVSAEWGSTHKYRAAANPFSIGVTWAQMTPSQVATAAALGITRT